MGDRGGNSGRGCKWHPRQQGEGVCAQCLRTSLEKLAAYQGEYQQEPLDSYTGAYSSTSITDLSRERDNNAQSYQPTYPNVSYRTRSKKESKPKGSFSAQDGSASDARKLKDAAGSKGRLTWGGAVHRISSLRSAFTSLWKSDRQPEEKRKIDEKKVREKQHGKLHGLKGTGDGRKEKAYELQNASHSEPGRVNGELKRNSISGGKITPGSASSLLVSKFTHTSSSTEVPQTRWRRSKSTREAKSDPQVQTGIDHGPRTPDGNLAQGAPSPIQPVPHPSSKSSPWRFFSRSGSRRRPLRGFKVDTPKTTPKNSTALDSRQNLGMSNPMSRGFSPKPEAPVSTSKSTLSSPSVAKPDPQSQTTIGSKSNSWSRSLSPSSSKPSPLYLAPQTMGEIKGDSLSRDSIDTLEFSDQSKAADVHGQRGTRCSLDGGLDSVSPRSFEGSAPRSNSFLGETVAAQSKADRSSIMSVTHKVDWPRVMPVQSASKSPLYKRPEIPRNPGSDILKLGAEVPRHMTGRGKASVADRKSVV